MNELLQRLLEQLRASSLAAKATAILVTVALVAAGVVAGLMASRPHFELLYAGLSAAEAASIQRALAEGGIRYEVSQPPGPFSLFIEEGERYSAQNLVAGAGALERAPKGIPGGESGLSTVFMSSGERAQMVRKREWEETEGMLQELDFVSKAKVRTSAPGRAPFGRKERVSASVTLTVAGGRMLDDEQAESVASLVRFGLGVDREQLVITDQHGRSVFDGGSGKEEAQADDWIEFQETHDRGVEARVNSVLAESFGDGRARVTIASEWDFDQVRTHSEQTENTKAMVTDQKRSSKTPYGVASQAAGGPAGTASNVGTFGTDQAGVVGADSSAISSDVFAETEDKRTEYVPSWQTTETHRTTPLLKRMSVSLVVDEALEDRRSLLEEVVKAAVGFDDTRGDQIKSMSITIPEVVPDEVAEDAPTEEEAPIEDGGGSPLMEKLVELGVEVAAALAFVFLLFKSVRSSKDESGDALTPVAGTPDSVDPETLAKARVDELLISDPDKVGEILSAWAREEVGTKG